MNSTKKFACANGYCHVLSDRLVITSSDKFEDNPKEIQKRLLATPIFFAFLALYHFYLAFYNYQRYDELSTISILYIILGIVMLNTTRLMFKYSMTNVILRDKITRVNYRKGFSFLLHPRIIIYFKNEQGKNKRREINLTTNHPNNTESIAEAQRILQEEGLLE